MWRIQTRAVRRLYSVSGGGEPVNFGRHLSSSISSLILAKKTAEETVDPGKRIIGNTKSLLTFCRHWSCKSRPYMDREAHQLEMAITTGRKQIIEIRGPGCLFNLHGPVLQAG